LALQNELARAIANEIQIKLTPQEQARLASTRQVSPEAHEAYLKGLYYWNQLTEEGIKKSIEYFQQAIAMDPTHAPAYARLAFSYTLLASLNLILPNEGYPQARVAAMKALEINEENTEAHAALGFTKYLFDWDWAEAEREFKRAIALNPNNEAAHHVYALYLAGMGRLDEATAEMKHVHLCTRGQKG
jgi:tetratricopeptide (TPR) repeat protein